MENSLLFNFGEIWPETMYYSTGTLTRFLRFLIKEAEPLNVLHSFYFFILFPDNEQW